MARRMLLGLALHGIFSHCIPSVYNVPKKPEVENNIDIIDDVSEHWHAIHGERVKKTHAFFNSQSAVPRLLVTLIGLRPVHIAMAWLMKHDS